MNMCPLIKYTNYTFLAINIQLINFRNFRFMVSSSEVVRGSNYGPRPATMVSLFTKVPLREALNLQGVISKTPFWPCSVTS